MDAIVDRIEEGYAVLELEDRSMLNVNLQSIGGGVREGSKVHSEDGIHWESTDKREPSKEEVDSNGKKRRIEALRSKLFK